MYAEGIIPTDTTVSCPRTQNPILLIPTYICINDDNIDSLSKSFGDSVLSLSTVMIAKPVKIRKKSVLNQNDLELFCRFVGAFDVEYRSETWHKGILPLFKTEISGQN